MIMGGLEQGGQGGRVVAVTVAVAVKLDTEEFYFAFDNCWLIVEKFGDELRSRVLNMLEPCNLVRW